jgi:hypothetical protein
MLFLQLNIHQLTVLLQGQAANVFEYCVFEDDSKVVGFNQENKEQVAPSRKENGF